MRLGTGSLLARILSVGSIASPTPRGCVLYVDPATDDIYDQRVRLTREACEENGVLFVPVWSTGFARIFCAKDDTTEEEAAEVKSALAPEPGQETEWAAKLGMPVLGVLCGTDAGLSCSERLLDVLGPPERSNGILRARRDKYEMHEAVRAAGLAAAEQAVASEWHEAEAFIERLPLPLAVVVKPRRGQASVRVGLGRTVDEARELFERVLELPATLDEDAEVSSVLLQEALQGEEWVVDTISREGEHKVIAIWRYDKGEANGARESRTSDHQPAHPIHRPPARPSLHIPSRRHGCHAGRSQLTARDPNPNPNSNPDPDPKSMRRRAPCLPPSWW